MPTERFREQQSASYQWPRLPIARMNSGRRGYAAHVTADSIQSSVARRCGIGTRGSRDRIASDGAGSSVFATAAGMAGAGERMQPRLRSRKCVCGTGHLVLRGERAASRSRVKSTEGVKNSEERNDNGQWSDTRCACGKEE